MAKTLREYLHGAAPAPAAPAPATAPKPAPAALQPTGSREQRLERLAVAMGAFPATLEAAIRDGTTPEEFVLLALRDREIEAKAKEILSA